MIKKRRGLITLLCIVMTFCMAFTITGCGDGSDETASASMEERFDYNADEVIPSDTADIAVLKGTWYDMGYQMGQQYKDEVIAATSINVAGQVESWGSYEVAVEAYQPYLELADEYFMHEKDGGLTDMIQGVADSTGMEYNDAMMLFISADSEIMPGEDSGKTTDKEDEKDCSAILAWGDTTGTKGVIGSMKADIHYGDLNFMPAMVMFPDNGNAFVSTHGVFGSVVNEKGFMVQCPGGSVIDNEEVYRIGIFPNMYLAAYCDNVKQAIKVLGDPEKTPEEEWWPATTDFNMCLGDAKGNACVFEIAGSERNIRYNGETKYVGKTDAGDAIVPNETGDYLCAANFYMSDNMLFTSRVSPQAGIDEGWPDGLVRYWTLEKYMQDAKGEATAEDLRKAMGSSKYYIPEGWDFDAFPEWGYYGMFVPNDIYEKINSGEATREDYYGEIYDPKEWGEAMSLADSRSAEEWSAGWHENNAEGNWTWNLDMCYWSPDEYAPDTKTALTNIFDSNTKTLYLMKGSENRALSNIPNSTGTYGTIRFDADGMAEMYGGDAARAMLQSMYFELEEQLWFAARDISEGNIKADSERGKALEKAKELIYTAQNNTNLGYLCDDQNEKMGYYAKAMQQYMEGQCYAKMAQDDPQTLEKDYGKYEPTMK